MGGIGEEIDIMQKSYAKIELDSFLRGSMGGIGEDL